MTHLTAPYEAAICRRNLQRLLPFYGDVLGFGVVEAAARRSLPAWLAGRFLMVKLRGGEGERPKIV